MTRPQHMPIIFLAFANDRQHSGAYLRNLGREADRLRTSLQQASAICEVIERHSVTPEQILQVFQQYKGRISIFHYAGHADDYTLLLENSRGAHTLADARGLAEFLRQQQGLQLVFLNACSTRAQADALRAVGVPVVIATARAIDDELAAGFADAFYQSLASGDTLASAFANAKGAVQFSQGELTRHLRPVSDPAEEHAAQGLPWELYQRDGATLALAWSLPIAAGDPLWRLPALPDLDLPSKPFRDLSWFRRADAPIFFGRGHQIRQLYTVVTDPKTAPLVLFYGQSGVGKSSLLDAGLLPRLEQVHRVVYLRRDQEQGLLGTLLADLPGSGAAGKVDAAWCAAEQATNKPFTLILDQVEEHFTRPNQGLPDEMEQFLAALVTIFADRSQRPQGKLILSFRKEWLAEIEKRLSECELPFSKVFLERLDETGVIEAVCGVAQIPALQQHYGLTIEEELADEIAHDLLKDREAAVAPMLQILLTRLWEEATQRERAKPHFDRPLYDQLRRDGLKLKEFLDRQLARLREQQAEVVDSGLALDLLSFHTTPLGTAEQRDFAALAAEYKHRVGILPELVRSFQNLYLLVDPAADQADSTQKSRLAHDTLAPLVRARFDESDLPGQRARRILESRAVDWADGREGVPLDEADLTLVEVGSLGMRVRNLDEERLVAASINLRDTRHQDQRNLETEREATRVRELASARTFRWVAIIASILLVIALTVSYIAYDQQQAAVASEAIAATRAAEAQAAQAAAETAAHVAQSRALTAASQTVAGTARMSAWLLAIESGRVADTDQAFAAVNDQDQAIGKPLVTLTHEDSVDGAMWNRDESRILSWSKDGIVRVWDGTSGDLLRTFTHTALVGGAIWNQDESRILSWSGNPARNTGDVRMWDAASGDLLHTFTHADPVNGAIWNRDESRILSWNGNSFDNTGDVQIWDVASGDLLHTFTHAGPVNGAMWNNEESHILSWSGNSARNTGDVQMWDATSGDLLRNFAHERWVGGAMWNRDESRILSWSRDGIVRVWDGTSGDLLRTFTHTGRVNGAMWNNEESLILSWSRDNTVRMWDAASGDLLRTLIHQDLVESAMWNRDESRILSWSWDGMVWMWDATNGDLLRNFVHESLADDGIIRIINDEDSVGGAIWNRDESRILSWSDRSLNNNSDVRVWDATSGDLLQTLTHERWVGGAMWNRDESRILSSSNDGTVQVWDAASGDLLRTLTHEYPVESATWNRDESRILSWSNDNTMRMWDAASGDLLRTFIHEGLVGVATWNRDESHILSWSNDGTVRVWDAASGDLLRTFIHQDLVEGATWNRDESRILSWSGKWFGDIGDMRMWDAASGDLLRTFTHAGPVNGAMWNNEESLILSWSQNGTMQVWNAQTGLPIYNFLDDVLAITSAKWNKAESQIMITTEEGSIYRYYTRMPDLLAAACTRATRNLTWSEWQQYLPGEPYRLTCPTLPPHPSVPADALVAASIPPVATP